MAYETILIDVSDGIFTITLNRPERMNAWTYQMAAELADAIDKANADDDVIAIVFTGAGRGFCAGADVADVFKAQADNRGGSARARVGSWVDMVRNSKPMVAAVNGAAIGLGLTQILPMDMIVASEDAKFSVRFVKMGLVPELASSHFLPLRVGFGVASELMLTGKTIGADEALALRLADKKTSRDQLLTVARQCAKEMGENPQAALRSIKQLLSVNTTETDVALVQKREGEALAVAYKSPEHKEAIAAFLEKRQPDFKAARGRS